MKYGGIAKCPRCKNPDPKWEDITEVCENGREYYFSRCEHCKAMIFQGPTIHIDLRTGEETHGSQRV